MSDTTRSFKISRWASLIVQGAVSVVILYFFSNKLNFGDFITTLNRLSAFGVGCVFVLLVGQIVAVGVRLQRIAEFLDQTCDTTRSIAACWIAAFIAQTPLSAIGADAVKAMIIRGDDVTFGKSLRVVALDRVYGTITLLVLLSCLYVPLAGVSANLPLQHAIAVQMVLFAIAVAGMALIARTPERFRRFRLIRWVADTAAAAVELATNRRCFGFLIFISLIAHGLAILVMTVIAYDLGLSADPWKIALLAPLPIFMSHLPISIGGWGVREAAVVIAFSSIGVPQSESFAVSIVYGAASFIVSLPGALIWIRYWLLDRSNHAVR